MKRHYFIGQFNLDLKEIICLDTEIIHQIKDVLKLKKNEEVVLCDGAGKAVLATISEIGKKEIFFLMKNNLPMEKNKNKVILCAALLKKDNFEWLLQKAVEVGVDEIVPIISKHTVKSGINEKRWLKIIKEAAEQSQRLVLPKLSPLQDFEQVLKIKNGPILFFDPSGESINTTIFSNKTFSVFIGPEGGWSEKELELARQSGAKIFNLGGTILRGETAAIVATYLAKNII